MSSYSHQNAPTQFTEAGGIRFACRRFGKKGGLPLVFFVHLTGTMDQWDPALTDGFVQDREVILFKNADVSSSRGRRLRSRRDWSNVPRQEYIVYDLFRVQNGKIAEHWDVVEEVPAKSESKKANGKF
jgi:hypothetical protein